MNTMFYECKGNISAITIILILLQGAHCVIHWKTHCNIYTFTQTDAWRMFTHKQCLESPVRTANSMLIHLVFSFWLNIILCCILWHFLTAVWHLKRSECSSSTTHCQHSWVTQKCEPWGLEDWQVLDVLSRADQLLWYKRPDQIGNNCEWFGVLHGFRQSFSHITTDLPAHVGVGISVHLRAVKRGCPGQDSNHNLVCAFQ